MRLSLRVQLGAVVVFVTLAVVLAVLATSERRLVEEFERFEGGHDTTVVAAAAPRLEAWYANVRDFTWPGADSVLAAIARPRRVQLLLQSSSGQVVAATRADLRRASLSGGGTSVSDSPQLPGVLTPPGAGARPRALVVSTHAANGPVLRLMFDAPPRRVLHGPDGRIAGVVYSLDMPEYGSTPLASAPSRAVRGAARRALLLPALLGALVSVAGLLVASARLLEPVRALTAAARRMAAGDRSVRVPLAGASEMAELAGAFNGMAESIERSDSARRRMVSDVAHELRTPLANLRCRLEAMQDGLAPADAETLRALHGETLLLSRLVEDLQVLSLAEAGQLALHLGDAEAREIAARAVAATAPRAEAAAVTLALDAPAPAAARCDSERVGQMLRALLDNALAHTPAGGRVTVSVREAPQGILLAVSDTGPGIAREHLQHVFDRFWCADPARARAGGGAGLGLAIVRELARIQDGEVSATSEPGAGACFTIRLPSSTRFTPAS